MDDIPPSVAIVFMVCVAIITATIVICDCVKQKQAAPNNAVTPTESTTETDDTSTEGMTPAQQLLFMRLIKALP